MNPLGPTGWPEFERTEIARHNEDAQGYWLIIDGLVYDVTEFIHAHPGGDQILRLYAGRVATHGFRTAHANIRQVAQRLERHRIGMLRPPPCAARVEHADHHSALAALYSALELVVEMQNALAVDHSFELDAPEGASGRTRYELQRRVETHARFHREYLDGFIAERWSSLASSLSPAPDDEANKLATVQRSVECGSARARALELFEHFEHVSDRELTVAVAGFELQDRTLLQNWKHELSRGLRVLERAHAPVLQECERQVLHGASDRMLEHLRGYFQQ